MATTLQNKPDEDQETSGDERPQNDFDSEFDNMTNRPEQLGNVDQPPSPTAGSQTHGPDTNPPSPTAGSQTHGPDGAMGNSDQPPPPGPDAQADNSIPPPPTANTPRYDDMPPPPSVLDDDDKPDGDFEPDFIKDGDYGDDDKDKDGDLKDREKSSTDSDDDNNERSLGGRERKEANDSDDDGGIQYAEPSAGKTKTGIGGRFKTFATSRRGIFTMGFGAATGGILGVILLLAPVFGLVELMGLLGDFNLGSNNDSSISRNIKVARSFQQGGLEGVRIDRKLGKFDGKIKQIVLGKINRNNQNLYERSVKYYADRNIILEHEPFEYKGRQVNVDGAKDIPTAIREADGTKTTVNTRAQGIDTGENRFRVRANEQTALRRANKAATAKPVSAIVSRERIGKPVQFKTLGLGYVSRVSTKALANTAEVGTNLLKERLGLNNTDPNIDPDKLETKQKIFDDFKKGATIATAKLNAATAKVKEVFKGKSSIFLIGFVAGCFAQQQSIAKVENLKNNYDTVMRLAFDALVTSDEISGYASDFGTPSDISLDGVGEINEHLVSTETTVQTPIETESGDIIFEESEEVDSAFSSQSVLTAAGLGSAGVVLDPVFNAFNPIRQIGAIQSSAETIGRAIDNTPGLGFAWGGLCDLLGKTIPGLGFLPDRVQGYASFGNLIGGAFDIAACVGAAAFTFGAGCVAFKVVSGEALAFAITQVLQAVVQNDIGILPDSIAQNTGVLASGISELDNLQSRAGLPIPSLDFYNQARAYQDQLFEESKDDPFLDRFFAIQPGSPGLAIAHWKATNNGKPLAEVAVSTLANLPGALIGSIANNLLPGRAEAADPTTEAEADEIFFGQTKRSLDYLNDEFANEDDDDPENDDPDFAENFIERMGSRETCVYILFYDQAGDECNEFMPANQQNGELARDFAQDCMGLVPNSLEFGPSLDFTVALLKYNDSEKDNNRFEELCNKMPLDSPDLYKTIGIYKTDLETVEALDSLYAGPSSAADNTGNPVGLQCPELEAHPTIDGYFRMAEQSDIFYYKHPNATERQYGSRELICALYTMSVNYNNATNQESRVRITALTEAGHITHKTGINADFSADGAFVAANGTRAGYSTEATITLGKALVDTGVVARILWCEPGAQPGGLTGNDGSMKAIRDYATSKGLNVSVKCIAGHYDHFHIAIDAAYAQSVWAP